MSGLYTAAICASAALAAGLTSPVLVATASWELSLACWAVPAAVVALFWLPAVLRRGHADRVTSRTSTRVWSSALAWQLAAFMALQAMMSFSVFVWMAPILRSRGLDGVTAGLIVSVSIALQMGGSLAAPAVATRLKAAAGFALTILGPMEGIWLWTGLLGLGQGSLTAVALTMIVLRTRDEHVAGQVSGMMQCVGYGIGSSGTFLVGQLHAWTGGYAATAIMFGMVGALAVIFGFHAGRNRYIGETTTGLHG